MKLINEHLTRQSDLITGDLTKKINIIGCGAIGSFTALQLAKMGCTNIEVWDFDVVSVENMNSQFYRFKDIGHAKVTALYNLVKEFTNVGLIVNQKAFEPRTDLAGIVILAVDSMKARKSIFEQLQKCFLVNYFIDSRMGAESCLFYCMNPHAIKDQLSYGKTLYTDENAVQERCTAKATIYTANLLSGLITKTVKDLLQGDKYVRTAQWSVKDNDLQTWG